MSLLLALAASQSAPPHHYPDPTLNSIPTYDGSGHTIHPSVVDMGSGGWNGYRYWLADTPYAAENTSLENPSILCSHDGVSWQPPAGLVNPIDPWPGAPSDFTNYNSDTELVHDPDSDQLVCYWREVDQSSGFAEILHTATSPDGVTWTHHDPFTLSGYRSLSPAVVRMADGQWRLWTFSNSSATRMLTAPAATGPWAYAATNVTWVNRAEADWHGDVMLCSDGVLRGIYSPRGAAYPFTASSDGLTFTVGAAINSGARHYRPTLTEGIDGYLDMWWSDDQQMHVYRRSMPLGLWP